MFYRRTTYLAIALMLFAFGCNDGNQRAFRQEKRQFTIVMKSKLRQFERRTTDLSTQVTTDSVRTLEVDSLRIRHADFQTRVSSISPTNETQWRELKPTLEAEYYDLERRYYEIAADIAAQAARQATADTLTTSEAGDSLHPVPTQ
jgi:hypothetical protein